MIVMITVHSINFKLLTINVFLIWITWIIAVSYKGFLLTK
jgi:hypothetical protein